MNVILRDRCLEEAMNISGKCKSNIIGEINPGKKLKRD